MAGREDYFLRHIAMLREFTSQVIRLRAAGQHDQAMVVLCQAQEKLFGVPMDRIASWSLEEQLAALAKGSVAGEVREKRLGYALLLEEAAQCYLRRDRADIAHGALKAALFIVLRTMLEEGRVDPVLSERARELMVLLPTEDVDTPLQELLDAVERVGRDK